MYLKVKEFVNQVHSINCATSYSARGLLNDITMNTKE